MYKDTGVWAGNQWSLWSEGIGAFRYRYRYMWENAAGRNQTGGEES